MKTSMRKSRYLGVPQSLFIHMYMHKAYIHLLYACTSSDVAISNENKKEMFVCSWSKCMQFVFRIFVTK